MRGGWSDESKLLRVEEGTICSHEGDVSALRRRVRYARTDQVAEFRDVRDIVVE